MVSQNHGVGIEVHHALQRELGDDPVEGLVATYAGTGPEGLCVISVWESKAHADRFTVVGMTGGRMWVQGADAFND